MRIILALLAFCAAASAHAAPPNDSALISRMVGADANRDGSITKSELLAFRATNFARLDRDGNSILTKTDIPAFLRGRGAIDFDALIVQFDANRNGQVSRDEFVNGPTAVFDRADTNRDNILTEAERKTAIAIAQARQ